MKLNRKFQILAILAMPFLFSGCASIMHGTTQQIGVSSSPSGAKVTVNGQQKGKTPVILDLKRGDNHVLKIELDGYLPYETTLTKKVSGWVWGNVVAGGLIGLAVDAISGGLYNLTPEQVQASLAKGAQMQLDENGLYVMTTFEVDPEWTKVGQLAKRQ